ncbi:hypothetical protein Syncc8109_0950 [Synechococcus sp. WH 8109]|nr:hypothetical protein Syncc8109_0950 [Synechococcus sp. WH 8109]
MAGGDQLLLDVRAIDEQLGNGATVSISGDAADAKRATDDQ